MEQEKASESDTEIKNETFCPNSNVHLVNLNNKNIGDIMIHKYLKNNKVSSVTKIDPELKDLYKYLTLNSYIALKESMNLENRKNE